MYNQKVFERFTNPKNVGMIKKADGIGSFKKVQGIDEIKIYLKIEENTIIDAKFKTFGGISTIASADAGMDLIKDKKIDEALLLSEENINEFLGGIPEEKVQSLELVIKAIADAIKNYRKKMIRLSLKS